jgi:hypothetical protein
VQILQKEVLVVGVLLAEKGRLRARVVVLTAAAVLDLAQQVGVLLAQPVQQGAVRVKVPLQILQVGAPTPVIIRGILMHQDIKETLLALQAGMGAALAL